ncbi:MAG: ABC transporter permease [Candidatus Rokubacteria bacterium]|nr:ABC transporter permease [Candidatus Rokubacteria bacterium]
MSWELFIGAGVLAATLRLATPIALAALGGVISERSGVVNIALEGSMLMGAFFGILTADKTGSIPLGLLAAIVAGGLLALLHAFAAIDLRSDQIVSGMAINILALGLTTYLNYELYGNTGVPASVQALPDVTLPLSAVPFLGDAIGKQSSIVWATVALLVVMHLFLFRTVAGLRLRAVGEHPRAAETVGIDVRRIRYAAVVAGGALAAIGGAYLSLSVAHGFTDGMTGGRGFIGLAAMIFGRWTPGGTAVASLIFGYGTALSFSLQGAEIGDVRVPVQLLSTLPYLFTILAVAGFVGRSRAPAADGIPYAKEGHA